MDEETLQAIHVRLVDGDPAARIDLFNHCLGPLESQLRSKWPRVPPEQHWDAIVDALYAYLDDPRRYEPTRGALRSYLFWSASRDLQNLLAREQRQRQRAPVSLNRVEDREDAGNESLVDRLPDERTHPERWLDNVDPELLAAVRAALPDALDRQVLALMADGERKTEVFAEAMGLTHLPPTEQRRLVKRTKDRIQKRVQREIVRRQRA